MQEHFRLEQCLKLKVAIFRQSPCQRRARREKRDLSLDSVRYVELHGLGSSINCLGRRVASYTTRDAKEIAKPLAMVQ